MSQENKEVAQKYVRAMSAHDVDAAVALVHTDLVNHAALPEAQGSAGLRTILTKVIKAFPDATWTIEDLIAEGDRVVCRVKMKGTNEGALDFLRVPLPPTGKRVESEAIHVMRIANGKVAEHWAGRDDIGMMRQLGQFPAQGATA